MNKQLAPHLAGLVVALLLLTPVFVFPSWTTHVRGAPSAAFTTMPPPQPTLSEVAGAAAATLVRSVFLPLTLRDAAAPSPQPPIPPPPGLPTDSVLLAEYPRIARTITTLNDGQVKVAYQVYNNVNHAITTLTLHVTALAEAGAVTFVSVFADPTGIFSPAHTADPQLVTCTFAIQSGQSLAIGQSVELTCTYREDDVAVVVQSETLAPEPFIDDKDFDQIHDTLAAQANAAGSAPLEVLVMLTQPVQQSDLDRFAAYGGSLHYTILLIDGFFGALPANQLYAYRADAPHLDFIEPNLPGFALLDIATANTRARRVWLGDSTGRAAIMTDTVAALTGDPRTAIAVIDTGLDPTHPGLGPYQDVAAVGWGGLAGGAKLVGWRDFDPRNALTPLDVDGHGSHVAGIAAGSGGGAAPVGQDMRGIAHNAKLVGVRLPQVGNHSAAFANALNWLHGQLATYHIVAVNQSYGSAATGGASRGWSRASERLVEAGVVLVNAAGNAFDDTDGGYNIGAPADVEKVLTVGAVNDNDLITYYSSNGNPRLRVVKPDVVAPGGGIVIDNNFQFSSQMLSVDSNQLEPFIDTNGNGVANPGDRCLDWNGNGAFDTQMDLFLDLNANGVRNGGEPTQNWNGLAGFQGGGDICLDTDGNGVFSNELWLDLDLNNAYTANGSTPAANDYRPMAGTSQASPVVAGEVALLVDGMTDYANVNADDEAGDAEDPWNGKDDDGDDLIDEDPGEWLYEEKNARLVKSIVLMSTFEVPGGEIVPNQWLWLDENGDGFRQRTRDEVIRDVDLNQTFGVTDVVISQGANGVTDAVFGARFDPGDGDLVRDPWFLNAGDSNDPRTRPGAPGGGGWDRGGKDHKEGYGRVAIDAAVEAVTKEFCAVESDEFGAGLTDKKVWARHLHLYAGKEYKLLLDGPAGADYDMYLYQGTPDANGDPVLARRPGNGGKIVANTPNTADEELTFQVRADGLYFLVIRRVDGAGQFTVRLITPEEWTVMAYLPAELATTATITAGLDALALKALDDMEQTGSGEEALKEFQLLALVDFDEHAWDGNQGAGSDPDHRGDAVLYCIRKDRKANGTKFSIAKQPAEVLELVNAGQPNQRAEANMGDPATLKKFVEWSIDYFPAKKYALILWGDGKGYGWKVNPDKALGLGNDNKRVATAAQDAQSDALEMKELRTALADVKSKINAGSQYKANTGVARRLDLLGFDLGHMALIDIGRQVQESVEVLVASEERIHADGWPYQGFLAALKCQRQANQRWQCDAPQKKDADALGKEAVAVYHTYYEDPAHPDPQHTLSATRLNPTGQPGAGACATFDALVNCVSAFAVELRAGVVDYLAQDDPADNVQIKIKHEGREASEEMTDKNYIDLRHFAEKIRDSSVPAAYKSQAAPIYDALVKGGALILANEHGGAHPNAHGLTLYFPHDQELPEDANCKDVPDAGVRTCGFDSPLPSPKLYAKDPAIRIPKLNRPPDEPTHPRPQIQGLRFPQETNWDEFLHRYYKPVADACIRIAGACVEFTIIAVGQTVTLSGHGSSDSDGPAQDDIPQQWYWDLNPLIDNAAPLPAYPITSSVLFDDPCTEDCDRDQADAADDDPDAMGELVAFTCPLPGFYSFRLMTHDEHNDQGHIHDEETHHVHWKLDSEPVSLLCISWLKISTPSTVTPGQPVVYTLTLHDPTLTTPTTAVMRDPLPDGVQLTGEPTCDPEGCFYNPTENTVVWQGVLTGETQVQVRIPVTVIPVEPPFCPPTITNRATVTYRSVTVPTTATTAVDCTTPSTAASGSSAER